MHLHTFPNYEFNYEEYCIRIRRKDVENRCFIIIRGTIIIKSNDDWCDLFSLKACTTYSGHMNKLKEYFLEEPLSALVFHLLLRNGIEGENQTEIY